MKQNLNLILLLIFLITTNSFSLHKQIQLPKTPRTKYDTCLLGCTTNYGICISNKSKTECEQEKTQCIKDCKIKWQS